MMMSGFLASAENCKGEVDSATRTRRAMVRETDARPPSASLPTHLRVHGGTANQQAHAQVRELGHALGELHGLRRQLPRRRQHHGAGAHGVGAVLLQLLEQRDEEGRSLTRAWCRHPHNNNNNDNSCATN